MFKLSGLVTVALLAAVLSSRIEAGTLTGLGFAPESLVNGAQPLWVIFALKMASNFSNGGVIRIDYPTPAYNFNGIPQVGEKQNYETNSGRYQLITATAGRLEWQMINATNGVKMLAGQALSFAYFSNTWYTNPTQSGTLGSFTFTTFTDATKTTIIDSGSVTAYQPPSNFASAAITVSPSLTAGVRTLSVSFSLDAFPAPPYYLFYIKLAGLNSNTDLSTFQTSVLVQPSSIFGSTALTGSYTAGVGISIIAGYPTTPTASTQITFPITGATLTGVAPYQFKLSIEVAWNPSCSGCGISPFIAQSLTATVDSGGGGNTGTGGNGGNNSPTGRRIARFTEYNQNGCLGGIKQHIFVEISTRCHAIPYAISTYPKAEMYSVSTDVNGTTTLKRTQYLDRECNTYDNEAVWSAASGPVVAGASRCRDSLEWDGVTRNWGASDYAEVQGFTFAQSCPAANLNSNHRWIPIGECYLRTNNSVLVSNKASYAATTDTYTVNSYAGNSCADPAVQTTVYKNGCCTNVALSSVILGSGTCSNPTPSGTGGDGGLGAASASAKVNGLLQLMVVTLGVVYGLHNALHL